MFTYIFYLRVGTSPFPLEKVPAYAAHALILEADLFRLSAIMVRQKFIHAYFAFFATLCLLVV